jgi:hypothetical protein
MKMLLGECLAVAVSRHARYRQVAQRYLESMRRIVMILCSRLWSCALTPSSPRLTPRTSTRVPCFGWQR